MSEPRRQRKDEAKAVPECRKEWQCPRHEGSRDARQRPCLSRSGDTRRSQCLTGRGGGVGRPQGQHLRHQRDDVSVDEAGLIISSVGRMRNQRDDVSVDEAGLIISSVGRMTAQVGRLGRAHIRCRPPGDRTAKATVMAARAVDALRREGSGNTQGKGGVFAAKAVSYRHRPWPDIPLRHPPARHRGTQTAAYTWHSRRTATPRHSDCCARRACGGGCRTGVRGGIGGGVCAVLGARRALVVLLPVADEADQQLELTAVGRRGRPRPCPTLADGRDVVPSR